MGGLYNYVILSVAVLLSCYEVFLLKKIPSRYTSLPAALALPELHIIAQNIIYFQ